jgi:hypothetical protein
MDATKALEIPNSLHDAVMQLTPLIKRLRDALALHEEGQQYELEARMGLLGAGRFVPGINGECMRQIEAMLSSFTGWDRFTQGWVYSQDYFYRVEGKQYRTSTTFEHANISTAHMYKTVLEQQDLQHVPLHTTAVLGHLHKIPVVADVRVSLAVETPVTELPPLVTPYMLRFKQRRSFHVRGWRYDLTKTWQANSRKEMEAKQGQEPVCEVEIECEDPVGCLAKPYHTDEYMATSLLLKMLDLLTLRGLHPLKGR